MPVPVKESTVECISMIAATLAAARGASKKTPPDVQTCVNDAITIYNCSERTLEQNRAQADEDFLASQAKAEGKA